MVRNLHTHAREISDSRLRRSFLSVAEHISKSHPNVVMSFTGDHVTFKIGKCPQFCRLKALKDTYAIDVRIRNSSIPELQAIRPGNRFKSGGWFNFHIDADADLNKCREEAELILRKVLETHGF